MSDESKPAAIKVGKLQVTIDDEVAQGIYSNFQAVGSNETEFVLDFAYVQPHQARAKVRARAIISPKHAKSLMMILQTRIKDFEARYGEIRTPMAPVDPNGGSGLPN